MKKKLSNKIIFSITEEDIQQEAISKLGRKLNQDEIVVAKDGLEWGLLSSIDVVYSTIFFEMIKNELGK